MSEQRALENLTVLDLTRVLAGPFCTMMMADMGARVIKIEMPVTGDDTRAYPPFRENCEGKRESLYFANINRNKSGLTLNLKSEEGKKIFRQLVKEGRYRGRELPPRRDGPAGSGLRRAEKDQPPDYLCRGEWIWLLRPLSPAAGI